MSDTQNAEDCVSTKPWSEVLSRSLKLFTFNMARESGSSFGRVVFYIVLGVIVLLVATYVIDSMTGWFSSMFDFWPFNRDQAAAVPQAETQGWFSWGAEAEGAAQPEEPTKWYCKWNPTC